MDNVVATADVTALVWETRGGWSLGRPANCSNDGVLKRIKLSLQGSEKYGFHFIMEPEGLFAADHHCDDLNDAIEAGSEVFGIRKEDWSWL